LLPEGVNTLLQDYRLKTVRRSISDTKIVWLTAFTIALARIWNCIPSGKEIFYFVCSTLEYGICKHPAKIVVGVLWWQYSSRFNIDYCERISVTYSVEDAVSSFTPHPSTLWSGVIRSH